VREKLAAEVDGVRARLEKELDAFADAIGQKILGRAV
jgi:F-type H+-transporting ATPase subunit b